MMWYLLYIQVCVQYIHAAQVSGAENLHFCVIQIFRSSESHKNADFQLHLPMQYVYTVQILVCTKDTTSFCAEASVDVDMMRFFYKTKYSLSMHSV